MHHSCAVRMETVRVHVASSLSVDLIWWLRPNHAHGTRPSAEIPVRGFTVDNKSDEALRRNGGATLLGEVRRVSVDQRRIFGTSNLENFTDMFFHSAAFNRKLPLTPILRGTPSQYKRRISGSASVLSQYASGRMTSNSKHSHRFPSPQAQPSLVSLHWFRGDTSH